MTSDQALDLPVWSARDILVFLAALRETKPRDPLRAAEDAMLDLVNGET